MFKDNCCKREILALQIYCRNESRGCAEQLTLGHLLVSTQVALEAFTLRNIGPSPHAADYLARMIWHLKAIFAVFFQNTAIAVK